MLPFQRALSRRRGHHGKSAGLLTGRGRAATIPGGVTLSTSDFDFDLPSGLIAQRPAEPRDAARLLHVGDGLADRRIADLPDLLRPGDLLVVNDTRVIPARLFGRRGAARVEALLHRRVDGRRWLAFARPGRRLRQGDRIAFPGGLEAVLEERREGGEALLAFSAEGAALDAALEAHGAMPLPPYIRRPPGGDAADRDAYQTVFARKPGSVAAPTAGLHFTPRLLAALEARGVERVAVTLHVGAGTFLPVRTEDPAAHRMHSEWGRVTAEAAARIRGRRGRLVVAGTTALRLLESAADAEGRVAPWEGETDIFLRPGGHEARTADLLLTNFHLPRSTLFMLVAAFAGLERMRAAYAHAIARRYRFYSYGDACLLERTH